jgi:hypothetical protein
VSNEKSAYVVRSSASGSSMYHCKVDRGMPICTEVEEASYSRSPAPDGLKPEGS